MGLDEWDEDDAERLLNELELMIALVENRYKPETYKKVIQRMNDLNITHNEAIKKIRKIQ